MSLPVDDGEGGGGGIKPNWAKPEMCEIESRSPIGVRGRGERDRERAPKSWGKGKRRSRDGKLETGCGT